MLVMMESIQNMIVVSCNNLFFSHVVNLLFDKKISQQG
jgi:hypothetical protein